MRLKIFNKNYIKYIFIIVVALSFVALVLPVISVVNASTNLVGYWKFDETVAGSTVVDSSSNGNDGTPTDDPVPSTSVPPAINFTNPRSLSFDGSQYVTINRPVEDDFSICAWIKTTVVGSGDAHWETAPIMESEVSGLAGDFGFGIGDTGKLRYGNGGELDTDVEGNATVNDDEWHHACVTRSTSSGEAILYVDGEEDASETTSTNTLDDSGAAYIGFGTDGAEHYTGLMDDLRAYDIALSPSQIANLYNGSMHAESPIDNDDITSDTENSAPNEGDGNDDDIPDDEQGNVTSFVSGITGKYVTLEVSDSCEVIAVSITAESDNTVLDSAYKYPEGLVNFVIDCDTPGATASVRLLFHDAQFDPFDLRKYNPDTNGYSLIDAHIQHTTIGDRLDYVQARYNIKDGGELDQDGITDGVIVDPVGLGENILGAPDTGFQRIN